MREKARAENVEGRENIYVYLPSKKGFIKDFWVDWGEPMAVKKP